MTGNQKKLFLNLCSFSSADGKEIEKNISKSMTPEVLGLLYANRMQTVAYKVIEKFGLFDLLGTEVKRALRNSYMSDLIINDSYMQCVDELSQVLTQFDKKYAALKGAVLCRNYPLGCRTSNDVDILVSSDDVSGLGNILAENGFVQGYVRDGVFYKASRKEIITSKMMRGETVPYVKEVNKPLLKYFELDLNFSLDYKSGSDNVREMLLHTESVRIQNKKILTLQPLFFFIHLCCHLYKEMTTLPWIKMKKDMTMYKFLDIAEFLRNIDGGTLFNLYHITKKLGVVNECSCAILWTCSLIHVNNPFAAPQAAVWLKGNEALLHTVVSPSDNKKYIYKEERIAERFFLKDRVSNLVELKN